MSRAMGQSLNFRLAHDQVVYFETGGKFLCQGVKSHPTFSFSHQKKAKQLKHCLSFVISCDEKTIMAYYRVV